MPRAAQSEIRLRLVVDDPVPGVVHSLQNAQNQAVDSKSSTGAAPLVFEFSIRLTAGSRFSGLHVRRSVTPFESR